MATNHLTRDNDGHFKIKLLPSIERCHSFFNSLNRKKCHLIWDRGMLRKRHPHRKYKSKVKKETTYSPATNIKMVEELIKITSLNNSVTSLKHFVYKNELLYGC